MSCVSRLACSSTGSIKIASFVVKSASKYVYVLLTESNNCVLCACVACDVFDFSFCVSLPFGMMHNDEQSMRSIRHRQIFCCKMHNQTNHYQNHVDVDIKCGKNRIRIKKIYRK